MKIWLPLLLLLPLTTQAAIYRWVDEAGNIVYSDQPRQGAEKVELPGLSTYKPTPSQQPSAAPPLQRPATITHSIRIITPTPGKTVIDSNGNVGVQVAVAPALQAAAGQRVAVSLDDSAKPVLSSTQQFQLTNVDRGTHTLHTWVVGPDGKPLSPRASVTFYMRRAVAKPQPPAGENGADKGPYAPPPEKKDQYLPPADQKGYAPPANGEGYKPPANGEGYKPPANGKGYKPPANGKGYKPPAGFKPQ